MLEKLKGVLTEEQMKDLEKYIQSETDKVRTKYLAEIKELEKYKPKEKTPQEIELEKRIAELETKQKEVEAKEKFLKVQDTLTANNLPKELAKYVSAGDDLETFGKEIVDVLNNHMLNNSYKPKDHKKNEGISKEQFRAMSYVERVQLQEKSPELFKKLSE